MTVLKMRVLGEKNTGPTPACLGIKKTRNRKIALKFLSLDPPFLIYFPILQFFAYNKIIQKNV